MLETNNIFNSLYFLSMVTLWLGAAHQMANLQPELCTNYQLQAASKSTTSASSSDPSWTHSFWKTMGGMAVPKKIKVFMWRACNSSLPTKTNRFKPDVIATCSCQVSHDEAETILYILWPMGLSGTQEQLAWQNSPPHNIFTSHRVSDWSDVVEEVLRGQSKHNTKLFFTLAWMIWGNRNNVWLQKSDVVADKMCEKAVDYMEE